MHWIRKPNAHTVLTIWHWKTAGVGDKHYESCEEKTPPPNCSQREYQWSPQCRDEGITIHSLMEPLTDKYRGQTTRWRTTVRIKRQDWNYWENPKWATRVLEPILTFTDGLLQKGVVHDLKHAWFSLKHGVQMSGLGLLGHAQESLLMMYLMMVL